MIIGHDRDANSLVLRQRQRLTGTEQAVFIDGIDLLNHRFSLLCPMILQRSGHRTNRISTAGVLARGPCTRRDGTG